MKINEEKRKHSSIKKNEREREMIIN